MNYSLYNFLKNKKKGDVIWGFRLYKCSKRIYNVGSIIKYTILEFNQLNFSISIKISDESRGTTYVTTNYDDVYYFSDTKEEVNLLLNEILMNNLEEFDSICDKKIENLEKLLL